VCGMKVVKAKAVRVDFDSETFYFCFGHRRVGVLPAGAWRLHHRRPVRAPRQAGEAAGKPPSSHRHRSGPARRSARMNSWASASRAMRALAQPLSRSLLLQRRLSTARLRGQDTPAFAGRSGSLPSGPRDDCSSSDPSVSATLIRTLAHRPIAAVLGLQGEPNDRLVNARFCRAARRSSPPCTHAEHP